MPSNLIGVPDAILRTTYVSLDALSRREPQAFADLAAHAWDRDRTLPDSSRATLQHWALVDVLGNVHAAVRAVVASVTTVDPAGARLLPIDTVMPSPPARDRGAVEPMSDDEQRALIAQCLRIVEIFDEEVPDYAISPDGHRVSGANGFHKRTSSGLYLEWYYGSPSELWTPWGYWGFVGSGSIAAGGRERHEAHCAAFMARLTTELHAPLVESEFGATGPVYKILAVDGVPLPTPGEVLPTATRDEYKTAKADWARFGGPHTTYGT